MVPPVEEHTCHAHGTPPDFLQGSTDVVLEHDLVEAMGLERLHARTNAGFDLKVHASLIVLQCWNAYEQSRYVDSASGQAMM